MTKGRLSLVIFLLIVVVAVFPARSIITRGPSGSWTLLSTSADVRPDASAALMDDGRVLIAGGMNGEEPSAAAQVFTSDGEFVAVASMSHARGGHQAVKLAGGAVLIAGGVGWGGNPHGSAEIYDPASDSWTSTEPMVSPRTEFSATLLKDGRVLLAGGNNGGAILSSMEIFDPQTQAFSSSAAALGTPRRGHSATLLMDGRVLIAGGSDGSSVLSTTEVYDPATDSMAQGPSLAAARMEHSASRLLDGSVLLAGGSDGSADLASAEIVDAHAFADSTPTAGMAAARRGHRSVVLPDNGSVLILGGASGSDAIAEVFRPASGTFVATSAQHAAHSGGIASALSQEGVALSAGGGSTEVYSFATVKTDKEDYAPGTIVTITGSGWEPGETVGITLHEVPELHEELAWSTTADETGAIHDTTFSPEWQHQGVRFYLVASGSVSEAMNTFTDGTPTRITSSSMSPSSGACRSTITASATLEFKTGPNNSPFAGLAGKPVTFTLGTESATGITGSNGVASVSLTVAPGAASLRAEFAGDATFNDTATTIAFSVTGVCNNDSTAPVITPNVTGLLGTNGWYVSNVSVGWSVSDPESSVTNMSGCGASSVSADTNGVTFTCIATSAGGTGSRSVTIKRDATAPSASLAVTSGTLGANGWYTSDVTLATSGSDSMSGPVSCTPLQQQTTDTAGTTFFGSCTNGAGLISPATPLTIKVDKTGPNAVIAVTDGTAGANGWYVSDVTIGTSGSDSVSGPVTCTADQHQSDETDGTTFNGSCTNAAGQSMDAAPLTVKVDKTGPSAQMAVTSGTAGSNGWYTSDVTIGTSGSDSVSGPVTCTGDQHQNDETTGAIFSGSCTNDAGLSTDAAPLSVKVDKTGPSAQMAVTSGTAGSNGWYTSDVTIGTSGSDEVSGPVTCTGDQHQNDETTGASFSGSCTNDAGLITGATLTVKVDKTGPSAQLGVISGTPGSNGWYISDVTIGAYGSDSISGPVSCTGDQYQTSDTTGATFNGSCTNQAGLSTSAAPKTIKLDKTAPVISITSPGSGGYVLNSVVASQFSCSDATSGVSTCSGSLANGASLDTASIGSKSVTVTSTDLAGNQATLTKSYNVQFASLGACLDSTGHTILQPINADGTSVFKQKSTVPAKFRVCDANGVSVGSSGVVSSFRLIQKTYGTATDVDEAVLSTTPDTDFRWDPTGRQWIFNMSTKMMIANTTYVYRVTLADNTTIDFAFGLR
ncbi:MAG TPA: kelch repeat-containing protein [Candidatus Polarisedimenticolia bacterium]|nr:kelch repeat-containing protein [Candidatus Polarisedimenticolia bacterium]